MPRKHKRALGSRPYTNWTNETLQTALTEINAGSLTYREAEEKYKIPKSTLQRKINNRNMKNVGRPTELNAEEEKQLVDGLILLGDWGYPVSQLELRLLVKSYLDSSGAQNPRFKENMPGEEWCASFMERHKGSLSTRLCANIKRSRSEVSREELTEYFNNLQESLIGVTPENLINYDETNMSDDPGRKKVLIKRGSKRVDRIIDSSKTSTSVMFAAAATGVLLPLYVVYKSEHMHSTWIEGGRAGTRYNRSRSGWFDSVLFEDFFDTVLIKYFNDIEKEKGEKCLKLIIGDNLSSHMSLNIIRKCQEHNIRCTFMPPNATHLCQPLDVAFFRGLKEAWRNTLTNWKLQNRGTVPKDTFPRILKNTLSNMGDKISKNIMSGFKAAGIYPYDPNSVLKRLPEVPQQSTSTETRWSDSFLDYLKNSRERPATQKKRRTKLNVPAGSSVTEDHVDVQPSSSHQVEVVCFPSDNESEESENNIRTEDISEDPLMIEGYGEIQENINYLTENTPRAGPSNQMEDGRTLEEVMDFVTEVFNEIEQENAPTAVPSNQTKDVREGVKSVEVSEKVAQENVKKKNVLIEKKLNDKQNEENVKLGQDHKDGDFIIVKLTYNEEKKNNIQKYFVAVIVCSQPDGFLCNFLRKSQKTENTFIFPTIEDEMVIKRENIERILKAPVIKRGRHLFEDISNIKF